MTDPGKFSQGRRSLTFAVFLFVLPLAVGAEQYARPEALVDTAWLMEHLAEPDVHLIDVSSTADVYREGRIPGAHFLQWNTDLTNPDDPVEGQILTGEALSELMSGLGVANDHTVVFYDNASNLFAARAYWVMKYYRHDDARVYNGGRKKWIADGGTLDTEAAAVTRARYVAGEPDPAIVTDWQFVVDHIGDTSTLYCDARRASEHEGAELLSEHGGRIPGSINIEWRENVREDGTFRDAAELTALYREAGFTPDRTIVTYCQTGVRGAHTWFVLSELLGYPEVRNYDGSWAEYGNRDDSPLESGAPRTVN